MVVQRRLTDAYGVSNVVSGGSCEAFACEKFGCGIEDFFAGGCAFAPWALLAWSSDRVRHTLPTFLGYATTLEEKHPLSTLAGRGVRVLRAEDSYAVIVNRLISGW